MGGPAIGRCLGTIRHPVIADHVGDAQLVVGEDTRTPVSLRRAMRSVVAPGTNRILVAPERQRQQLVRLGQAPKPLDREEAIDALEFWPQRRGQVEIALRSPLRSRTSKMTAITVAPGARAAPKRAAGRCGLHEE
jgi:hypothetical protein